MKVKQKNCTQQRKPMFFLLSIRIVQQHSTEKKEEIEGKGILNNRITSLIFEKLRANGIASHFVKLLSDTQQLVKK